MKIPEKWQKENLESIVKISKSKAETLRKLGNTIYGSGYHVLNKYLDLYKIDTSHFLGQSWNRGTPRPFRPQKLLAEILVERSHVTNTHGLKKRLIKENILKNECSNCRINNWRGSPLSLQLDHINGVRTDNRIENLRILCPNCHSQTGTFCRGTKKLHQLPPHTRSQMKRQETRKSWSSSKCRKCRVDYVKNTRNQKYCSYTCAHNDRKLVKNRPSKEMLENLLKNTPMTKIGKMYGVSDNTIRKWRKHYNKMSSAGLEPASN